jgi:hypothetical protein
VFRQQLFLKALGVLACRSYPSDDGLFFVPFRACQTADATILRYQSQGVDDLIFRRATTIEDGPFGFDKGAMTRFALVALTTGLGLAKFDDVCLIFTLR